jgi:hypothetical protein
MDLLQPQGKRKRGRPRKEEKELRAEGESPLWAIADAVMGIREDMRRLVKITEHEVDPNG